MVVTKSLMHVKPMPDGRLGVSLIIQERDIELFEILQTLILFGNESSREFWLNIATAYRDSQIYQLRGKHFVTGRRLQDLLKEDLDLEMVNPHIAFYRREKWTEGKEYIERNLDGSTSYLYDYKLLKPFFEMIRDVKLGLRPQTRVQPAKKSVKKPRKRKKSPKSVTRRRKPALSGRQAMVAVPETVEDSRLGE